MLETLESVVRGSNGNLRYSIEECVRVRMLKKKMKQRKEWCEEDIVEADRVEREREKQREIMVK